MADIHIHRKHALGLEQARKIAFAWAEDAENKHEMSCNYDEGKTHDCVSFSRSGVNGTLTVTKDDFELKAKLGFLVGAFKDSGAGWQTHINNALREWLKAPSEIPKG